MMERLYRTMAIGGTFLVCLALFCGCATVPKEAGLRESLRSVAEDYWKKRMEGKLEDTLGMEEKESLKKGNSQGLPLNEYYRKQAMVTGPITSYSIKDVTTEGNKGRVDLDFAVVIPVIPRPVHQLLTDEWVLQNGKWLHLFR